MGRLYSVTIILPISIKSASKDKSKLKYFRIKFITALNTQIKIFWH